MAQGEKIIGIDLGTTNSVVAVMDGSEPTVIPNQEGDRTTPSVVAFTDSGDTIVGAPARNQRVTNPTRTVYSAKRFMGRRHNEVASEEKMVPYQVKGAADEYVKIGVGDDEYTPQEISAKRFVNLRKPPSLTLAIRSTKPLSQFQRTSTMLSVRPPKMPVRSRASK